MHSAKAVLLEGVPEAGPRNRAGPSGTQKRGQGLASLQGLKPGLS